MATAKKSFKSSSPWLGVLPFIGVILFIFSILPIVFGGFPAGWEKHMLLNAIIYMIGWAGIGAGISHIFFGKQISKSIGFEKDPYELEVGFAGLSYGIAAVFAGSFGPEYWLAIILVSSIYRVGCGIGHVIQIVKSQNFAVNNTAILFNDFVVPAFLIFAFFAWS